MKASVALAVATMVSIFFTAYADIKQLSLTQADGNYCARYPNVILCCDFATGMEVTVNVPAISKNTETDGVTFKNDILCRAKRRNDTHATFLLPLDDKGICGTAKNTTPSHVCYSNEILFPGDTRNDGLINQDPYVLQPVRCCFNKTQTNQEVGAAVKVNSAKMAIMEQNSKVNLEMNFCHEENCTSKIELPHTVHQKEEMYVQLQMRVKDHSLKLVLQKCVASPFKDFSGVSPLDPIPTVDLIRSGCPSDKSKLVNLSILPSPHNESRFRFSAFDMGYTYDHLYIHCAANICNLSSKTRACQRYDEGLVCPLISRRRRRTRRATVDFTGEREIVNGPLLFPQNENVDSSLRQNQAEEKKGPDAAGGTKESDGGISPTAIIGVVIGSLVAVIVIMTLLHLAMRKKRHSFDVQKDPGSPGHVNPAFVQGLESVGM